MKYGTLTLEGAEYFLICNGEARFLIEDQFGTDWLTFMTPDNRDGFYLLSSVIEIMSQQAQLCRKYEGYEPTPAITAQQIRVMALPVDMPGIYGAALNIISQGMGMSIAEAQEDEDIDLGLLELNKKKESPAPSICE